MQTNLTASETLASDIDRAVADIWSTEPVDITRLRNGITPMEAGSFDQYFSTMVFALIYTLTMGEHVVFGLVKEANAESIPVDSLRVITRSHFGEGFQSTQFIGYVLAPEAETFGKRIVEVLDDITTHEEFSRVLGSYLTYLNILHWWLHIYFPWFLGEQFPQVTKGTVAQLQVLTTTESKGSHK